MAYKRKYLPLSIEYVVKIDYAFLFNLKMKEFIASRIQIMINKRNNVNIDSTPFHMIHLQ